MKKIRRIELNDVSKIIKEIVTLITAVLGVVLLVCNFFKIVPEDNLAITALVAYGCLIGPVITLLSLCAFFEIRNE